MEYFIKGFEKQAGIRNAIASGVKAVRRIGTKMQNVSNSIHGTIENPVTNGEKLHNIKSTIINKINPMVNKAGTIIRHNPKKVMGAATATGALSSYIGAKAFSNKEKQK